MKNYLRRFNWFAFVCMAALMAVGVLFVYSANFSRESLKLQLLYRSQAELALFGILAGFGLAAAHYRRVLAWSALFYLAAIALLVAVLVMGTSQMGAKRWVFGIQPAELAKLATILALAAFLGREEARRDIIDFLVAGAITLLPMALIFLQPDLGTALVFPPILAAMLFVSGTAPRALLATVLAGHLAAVVVFRSLEHFLVRNFSGARSQLTNIAHDQFSGQTKNLLNVRRYVYSSPAAFLDQEQQVSRSHHHRVIKLIRGLQLFPRVAEVLLQHLIFLKNLLDFAFRKLHLNIPCTNLN